MFVLLWGLVYNTIEPDDTVQLVFGANELKSITASTELGCIQSADESREVQQMSATSNIHRDATHRGYYNLSGQRMAQPTRGLYIVNGKKVIISR